MRASGGLLCYTVRMVLVLACLSSTGCGNQPARPSEGAVKESATRTAASTGLFVDLARQVGIDFTHVSGATPEHRFAEITGSGCALFDYDRDGWLDVLLLNAGPLGGPPAANALYRNVKGRFEDVTRTSGLMHTGYSQGVAVGDYDNDGFPDLYVTAYGGNRLFHNEGGSGRFVDVSATAGVADLDEGERYSLSAAWGDYDRDGDLDLCVTHYVVWSPETDEPCLNALEQRGYCNPEKYPGDRSRLFRNEGNGRFTDISRSSGIAAVTGRAMGVAWLDYNRDGWQDLFIACDLTPNLLFRNTGKGTFAEVALDANVALGEMGQALSGMGVAVADYDNDGRDDLHVTNFSHQPNSLFRNGEGGLFENASVTSGLAEPSNPLLGWGCEFLDYDLDGHRDLVVANGHIQEEIARLVPGLTHAQPKSLYHNQGDGTFVPVREALGGLAVPTVARGLAVGDYDNDGRPDLLVNNHGQRAQLLRNTAGDRGHWITFELQGRKSNREARHARIILQTGKGKQSGEVRAGTSFCSASDSRVHFGLGEAATVRTVEVRWPSGQVARAQGLEVDRIWRWIEGEVSPR